MCRQVLKQRRETYVLADDGGECVNGTSTSVSCTSFLLVVLAAVVVTLCFKYIANICTVTFKATSKVYFVSLSSYLTRIMWNVHR
jgi:hypothetical protein